MLTLTGSSGPVLVRAADDTAPAPVAADGVFSATDDLSASDLPAVTVNISTIQKALH